MTRSELSISHFCARGRTRPRPSKPYASQAGWATRPRRGHAPRPRRRRGRARCATISPGGRVLDGDAPRRTCATPLWASISCSMCCSTRRHLDLPPRSARSLQRDYSALRAARRNRRGYSDSSIEAIPIGSVGRSPPSVGTPSSLSTTSIPSVTCAEHRVLAVQPRARVGGDDEELRAVRVRPGVGHRQRAADDLVRVDLVLERVPGPAGARSLRTAALDHEVLDHAVEGRARHRSPRRRACGSSRPSSGASSSNSSNTIAPSVVCIVAVDIGHPPRLGWSGHDSARPPPD